MSWPHIIEESKGDPGRIDPREMKVLIVFQICKLNRLTMSVYHHLGKQHSSCPDGPDHIPI